MKIDDFKIGNVKLSDILNKYKTPFYLYDYGIIKQNIERIKNAFDSLIKYKIHFALMCNSNIHIISELKKLDVGAFASSVGEARIAFKAGMSPSDIIINGSNFTYEELCYFAKNNLIINIDSLGQLEKYGQCNPNTSVGLRIKVANVIKKHLGPGNIKILPNRLGITLSEISKAISIAKKYRLRIIGLHNYIGTTTNDISLFIEEINTLKKLSSYFEEIEYIDIGGGFAIEYSKDDKAFDWLEFRKHLKKIFEDLSKEKKREISLKLEPGRSILGNAGMLITEVIDIKKQYGKIFIGVNAGMPIFARPYIYDAYHKIEVLNKKEKKGYFKEDTYICGNTVSVLDFFAQKRKVPMMEVGDILIIKDTGAYGYSMSSNYCGKLKPAEIYVKNNTTMLIRDRQEYNDLLI